MEDFYTILDRGVNTLTLSVVLTMLAEMCKKKANFAASWRDEEAIKMWEEAAKTLTGLVKKLEV